MGVITEAVKKLVSEFVRDRGLVLWFDPERHYESVARGLNAGQERVLVFDGDVRPPIPRRYAHLFGQIINAVDGSPFVAAYDDQPAGDAGQRFRHDLDEKRFPFAGNLRNINFAVADQLVNDPAFPNRADNDCRFPKTIFPVSD